MSKHKVIITKPGLYRCRDKQLVEVTSYDSMHRCWRGKRVGGSAYTTWPANGRWLDGKTAVLYDIVRWVKSIPRSKPLWEVSFMCKSKREAGLLKRHLAMGVPFKLKQPIIIRKVDQL